MTIRRFVERALNKLRYHLLPYYHGLGSKYCPVCDHAVRSFLPVSDAFRGNWRSHGFDLDPARFETLNLDDYSCPLCTVSDRDRIYALYMKKLVSTGCLPAAGRFIEFAPIGPLTAKLKSLLPGWEYRKADLMMAGVDDQIDICDMSQAYADESVDMFLCSHVLEHVPDDVMALSELFRILKPGGRGILMVPIHLDLQTAREGGWTLSATERWRLFGQDDHVRLHSKNDWMQRITQVGFRLECVSVPFFQNEPSSQVGILASSILYIAHKAS